LRTSLKQEEDTKGIQIGKEVVKLSLFADEMILYLKNLKTTSKNKNKKNPNPRTLPVGMQASATTLEKNLEAP
jgi:hypothetical protein